MKLLDLNDSPWTLAYVRIVHALRDDPTLRNVIHPDGWNTYIDRDNNDAPPGEDTLPAIEVLPYGMPASSESPVAQYSPFGVAVNIATEGTDCRDLLNLWWAVHSALFTGDGTKALAASIRADFAASGTGAQLESITLGMPAIQPSGPDLSKQIMAASGSITITLRVKK